MGPVRGIPAGLLQQYAYNQTPARKRETKQFERHLGTSLADNQADIRKKSLYSKRIHAEIQLLFYYEQQPPIQLRPRVICATKMVCYLYSVFLGIHG